jgi:hypothetical protein
MFTRAVNGAYREPAEFTSHLYKLFNIHRYYYPALPKSLRWSILFMLLDLNCVCISHLHHSCHISRLRTHLSCLPFVLHVLPKKAFITPTICATCPFYERIYHAYSLCYMSRRWTYLSRLPFVLHVPPTNAFITPTVRATCPTYERAYHAHRSYHISRPWTRLSCPPFVPHVAPMNAFIMPTVRATCPAYVILFYLISCNNIWGKAGYNKLSFSFTMGNSGDNI